MKNRNKSLPYHHILAVLALILGACTPVGTPEPIIETVVVTETIQGPPVEFVKVVTPTPEPPGTRNLVVCLGTVPDTLWIYGGDMLASSHILEMIYDGRTEIAMDTNSFAYQPVIHEKLPSLADGDATLGSATASEGDTVVDAGGNPAILDLAADPPIMLVPAGGTPDDAFEYTGGDVELDQMTATFVMLPGLLWSDGTPLTSADSVYTFNLASDPDSGASKYTIDRTASYEAINDVTVVWTGLPGYKDAEYFTNFWQPLPEHQLGQYTALELLEAEETTRAPMGWGPYIIDEWIAGEGITLRKNPNYFRAGEGLPKFEKVILRFTYGNTNAAIAALLAGECDILDQTHYFIGQEELLLEMQNSGLIKATFTTGTGWTLINFGIQHIDYDDGYQLGVDRPDFFSDVRTRRAFLTCMDRQAVVDTITLGQSNVIDTYIPPEHPLYNFEMSHYDFDPEAGSALLEEVGWIDDDGDPATPRVAQGMTNVLDGTRLEVALGTGESPIGHQIATLTQGSLAQCGIQANLHFHLNSEWFADGPAGDLFGRRFDLALMAWYTGVEPPCDLYKSDLIPGPADGSMISIQTGEELGFPSGWGGGQNAPGFTNSEYDAACSTALSLLPGQSGYVAAHKEAQRIFGEQLPAAPLFLPNKTAATRKDMCNFIMDPTANSEFWNIEEFDYGEGCEN